MRDDDHAERVNDIAALAAPFGLVVARHGVDGEDLGWAEGHFDHVASDGSRASVGVLSMVLSTLMELAIEAALPEGARLGAASSLRTTPEGPVPSGHRYALRAEVVGLSARAARAEASLIDEDGRVLVRGEATYHVTRD